MKSRASTATWTASSAEGVQFLTADVHYFVDAQVGRVIQRVLRKAAQWKRDCCGKRTGKKVCEAYGCVSLDELLKPLRDLRIATRSHGGRPKKKRKVAA